MGDDGGGRPSWRTVRTDGNDGEDVLPRVGEIKITIAHAQAIDAAGAEDGLRDRGRQAIGNHNLVGAGVDIEAVDDAGAEIAHEDMSVRKPRHPFEVRGLGHVCDFGDLKITRRGGLRIPAVQIQAPDGPGSGCGTRAQGVVACDDGKDVRSDFGDAGQGQCLRETVSESRMWVMYGFEEVELRGIKAGEQKLAIRADCNVFKPVSFVIDKSITDVKRIMGGSYGV